MAHCQKLNKGAIGAMIRHDNRLNEHYSNELIDPGKTYLNKQFCTKPLTEQEVYAYAESHMVKKLSNANYACSWVISRPMDLKEEDTERFFSLCHQFMCERYGINDNENIVTSAMHMDESNPHLHFVFMPMYYNKKKDGYYLSAKQIINQTELKRFHPQLNEFIDSNLGYHVELLNGKTLNRSISELKEECKAQEQYKARIEEIDNAIVQGVDKYQEIDASVPEITMFNHKTIIAKQSEAIDQLQQVSIHQQELINEQARLIESYKRCEPKIDYILASNDHRQVIGTKRLDIQKQRLDELETSIDKTQSLLDNLNVDNPVLQNFSDDERMALAHISKQPKDWLIHMIKKLADMWNKLSKQYNNLQSRVNSLASKNARLESYNSSSKIRIDNLETTNKELKSSNQELTRQVSVLQNQNKQLQDDKQELINGNDEKLVALQTAFDNLYEYTGDLLYRHSQCRLDVNDLSITLEQAVKGGADSGRQTEYYRTSRAEERTHDMNL